MNIPDLIKEKVIRFVDLGKNPDGGVVFINGEWGSGKTYFWKNLVKEMNSSPIYISLFGINDLSDVKATIFSAFVAGSESKSFLGKARSFAAKSNAIKRGAEFAGIDLDIDIIEFVKERKIFCFDDLERMSKDASIEEVLGFINYLSEHKAHRCVVIMNATEMSDSHRKIYGKLQEKLSMVRIEFGLDVADRLSSFIAVRATTECNLESEEKIILNEIAKLNLSNLRVIKRALDLLFEMKDLLKKPIPEEVVKFLICTLIAESKKSQPESDFYRFNPVKFLMAKNEDGFSELEKEQKVFYETYFGKNSGYRPYFSVIKLVKYGYVDSSDLTQEIYGSDDEKDLIAKRINRLKNVHLFFCTDTELISLQTEISQILNENRNFTFTEVATLIRTLSSTIKLLEDELPLDLPEEVKKVASASVKEIESLAELKSAFGYRGDDLIEPFRDGMLKIVDSEGLRRAEELVDVALSDVDADLLKKAFNIDARSFVKCANPGVIRSIFSSAVGEERKYQIVYVIIEAFKSGRFESREANLDALFSQLVKEFDSETTKTGKLRIYRLLEKTGMNITVNKPKSIT